MKEKVPFKGTQVTNYFSPKGLIFEEKKNSDSEECNEESCMNGLCGVLLDRVHVIC